MPQNKKFLEGNAPTNKKNPRLHFLLHKEVQKLAINLLWIKIKGLNHRGRFEPHEDLKKLVAVSPGTVFLSLNTEHCEHWPPFGHPRETGTTTLYHSQPYMNGKGLAEPRIEVRNQQEAIRITVVNPSTRLSLKDIYHGLVSGSACWPVRESHLLLSLLFSEFPFLQIWPNCLRSARHRCGEFCRSSLTELEIFCY